MRTAMPVDASTIRKLGAMTIMAMALAACGGGSSDDDDKGGGTTPPVTEGPEEAGCFDECKKFLAALVDDFAGGAAPAAKSAKAVGDDLSIIVEGDKVTFSVASVGIDAPNPDELNDAFPVSDDALDYKLTIDKTTGEITVDNNDGKTYTLMAFTEATYFQEIDYAQTDLADRNKAHYAYLRFDPKAKTNAIGKDVLLRRQWTQLNGEDYPSPGVSISLNTHFQDCPGGQNICDAVMLMTNPEMHDTDDGDDPVSSDPHITGTMNGTVYAGTIINGGGNYRLGTSAGNVLAAQTSGNPPDVWSIQHIMAKVGTYNCGTSDGVGNITFMNSSAIGTDFLNSWKYMNLTTAHTDEGGKCTVKVTKADETAIEGTFTATVVGLGPANQSVRYDITNGSFSVPKQ